MAMRVAEEEFRPNRLGPKLRLRVDLHGVSLFGPEDSRTLIRWEWMEDVVVDRGVTIRSANAEIALPGGAFGLPPEELAPLLLEARSPERRVEVITVLGAGGQPRP